MSTLESVIIPIPVITDFHVVQDRSFDIRLGGELGAERSFTLQPFPTGESLWLVAWHVCTHCCGTVEYEVRINNQLVAVQSVQGRDWHLVQEALGGAVVPAGPNRMRFRTLSGGARLSIGDMTLFFRDGPAVS